MSRRIVLTAPHRTAAETARRCCLGFAAAAFLIRAALAIAWPTIHRPDETFQNLEPAYRLLTGWGVVTWEWRDGIRSTLFPGFLAGIFQAATFLHLPLQASVACILAAVSACGVGIGAWLGWRRAAWPGLVLCGTLGTLWPDWVYFGPKPLLEVQAGNLLVIAAALACLDGNHPRSRLLATGLLLGLTFDLRFQLAPACAAIALFAARGNPRAWLTLLAAFLAPVLLLGIVDALTLGSPFQSIWKNVEVNFLEARAEFYGVAPPFWYIVVLVRHTAPASLLLAPCFALGARLAPPLAAAAAIVVLFHSLIAHKELSFIYAALPCTVIVSGLGAARLLARLAQPRPRLIAMAALACVAACVLSARNALFLIVPSAQPQILALWQRVRADPNLCGLGLFADGRFPWAQTPGYVALQRNVPIYLLNGPEALEVAAAGFDDLIVDTANLATLPPGQRIACTGRFCLIHRDQRCTPVPGFDVNAVLQRVGQ